MRWYKINKWEHIKLKYKSKKLLKMHHHLKSIKPTKIVQNGDAILYKAQSLCYVSQLHG